eukprot:scaffold15697_cov40-Cyclotella_meneghiniana.AAC.10
MRFRHLSDETEPCEHEPLSDLLDSEWLTPDERLARQDLASPEGAVAPEGATVPEGAPTQQNLDGAGLDSVGAELNSNPDGAVLDPDGAKQNSAQPDPTVGPRRSSRLQAAKLKSGLLCGFLAHTSYALSAVRHWGQPPLAITNVGGNQLGSHTLEHPTKRILKSHLSELALLQADWDELGDQISKDFATNFEAYFHHDLADDLSDATITDVQPHILKAKLEADPDMPTYNQAMQSVHQEEWWNAIGEEMDTLENQLEAWSIVRREP